MGASLIQPYRVCEEGLRVVKHFKQGEKAISYYLIAVMLPAE